MDRLLFPLTFCIGKIYDSISATKLSGYIVIITTRTKYEINGDLFQGPNSNNFGSVLST